MSVEYGALITYDEDGFGAAGLDVNWACGSCHYDPAKVGDKVFDKAQLSAAALGMHSGGLTTTNADCLACHSTGTGGAPTITPGTNHHGVHSQCRQCHTGGHNSPVPDKHSNTFCLSCHTNSGSHGNHHSVPAVSAECVSCHTIAGVTVPPMTTRDEVVAGCTSCHTDIIASGTGDNHHRGHAPSDEPLDGNACQGCHSDNGGKATTVVSTALGLTGNEFQDAGLEGTITATSKLCALCHSEIDHGHGNFIQSGPNQNHHKGNCVTCHHTDGSSTCGTPGVGVTSPSPATVVNCTVACHTTMTAPYQHTLECLTCHEHPGPGVRPLKTQDACGQCHGGGTDSTSNPPSEGVPYINGAALADLANGMHTRMGGTTGDITANVTYSTDAPVASARVKLFKRKAGVWVMIKSGLTNASGSKTFSNLKLGKKYKIVVIKSGTDFNGAVAGIQSKVTFAMTDPKTVPIKLASDTTINVKQGASGSLPTITIMP
jgi:predicted CXXCH cytochrome family protein